MNPLRSLERNNAAASASFSDGKRILSFDEITNRANRAAKILRNVGSQSVVLICDNSFEALSVEIATLREGICLTSLPPFFTNEQIRWAADLVGSDLILTDDPNRAKTLYPAEPRIWSPLGLSSILPRRQGTPPSWPSETARISFTSGSTGTPKGICLDAVGLDKVARSLARAVEADERDVHLALLPLSVLLESAVAVHTTLLTGARCILPPLSEVGLFGSQHLDSSLMRCAIVDHRPTVLVLMPAMLEALTRLQEESPVNLDFLRFVAVGGAPTPAPLLRRAIRAGIPAFEGYGLTECYSVVSLNTSRASKIGTVGRPLDDVVVHTKKDGEIVVEGRTFLGSMSAKGFTAAPTSFGTGDLGTIDKEGFLTIGGRKKNVIVTPFGRNVSPEWVESQLCEQPSIRRALVRQKESALEALIFPSNGGMREVEKDVATANADLPDYARIRNWVVITSPLDPKNGTLTPSGKIVRDEVWHLHDSSLGHIADRNGKLPNKSQ